MRNYWISGATGAWGQAIISHLSSQPFVGKIVACCRGEARAAALLERFPNITLYLADIRDKQRISQSMRGMGPESRVIHAAALKRIDTALYSPTEMASVNIAGTQAVIEACITNRIEKAFFISTDKACLPSTFYGGTKFIAEQLWLSAADIGPTIFTTARFGNALGSTGSVLEIWEKARKEGKHLPMRFGGEATRFLLTLQQGAALVNFYLETGRPKVVMAPTLPATTLLTLKEAWCGADYPTTDIYSLPGEKLHEQLVLGGRTSAELLPLSREEVQVLLQKAGLLEGAQSPT